jgi:hypothetical protein
MELKFKPGKFALNRNTLETVIVKEVKDDKLLVLAMDGITESWHNRENFNLFRRSEGKWKIEGPPIYKTKEELKRSNSDTDKKNISERFK